jgi:hypothetical protein
VYRAIAGFFLTEVTRRNLDDLDDEPDEEYDGWEEFLTDEVAADLRDDIDSVDILSEDWKGTYPWDDENRDMTVQEDEVRLERHWEEQILASRKLEGAQSGFPKSVIELNRLKRN